MPTENKGMINQLSNMVAPQVYGDTVGINSTWKIVKSKRHIKEEKKSNYDKNFHPLRIMKTSTPTTKNNSKDDSSSRSLLKGSDEPYSLKIKLLLLHAVVGFFIVFLYFIFLYSFHN